MANKVRVSDYIASRCVEAGARHVFLVTGGGAMHLNDAFGRNKDLEPVCFHHEQAAAIAAESYYRLTNRLAVLNVTTGPGGINALNGVYGAYVDSLGMLVVSGQVKRETYLRNYPIALRQLGDQEVDIVSMARPVVKYATVLQDPQMVRQVMDKAIYLANHGRPGPVWVDVPVDVQGALIDPDGLAPYTEGNAGLLIDPDVSENTLLELSEVRSSSLDAQIDEIIKRLLKAKRPVVFAGMGPRISGMHNEFLQLLDMLKVPVVTGWNAHDVLTNDSPYYAGRPGTVGDRAGNFTVQNADFLLVLGSRLNVRQVSYNWKSFASHAWKVMVDVDQAELDKPTLNIDLKICANLQEFIPAFKSALKVYEPPKAHMEYLDWCRDRVQRYPTVLPEYYAKQEPINLYVWMKDLFDRLGKDEVVITGNGSACVVSFQAAELKAGQRLYTNSGNASMGYDLPAAIGASIALGGKKVICLAGDGSLMMNLQELQTVVGYHLPIKVVVLNNNGYHSIRQTQQAYFSDNMFGIGPDDGVTLPNFVELAKAFNIPSAGVRTMDEWGSVSVQELLNNDQCALIELFVDRELPFSPKLASRKLPDGTMVSPSLEDMAPFLSREEMAENLFLQKSES
ncbi:thiamine pyrophosphate-binding protein [Polynucleobacter paneuropaeus]|nr:thiamine pyrophosphate-binding protein [Polynucleobacter paneuropaeus]